MLTFGQFIATFVTIIAIWALFERFQVIEGWSFKDVCILYGVVQISYSIAEATARGFDTFDQMVKLGDFDRVLLRPIGTLFQIASQNIQLMRFGRFLQGLLVLVWGLRDVEITFFLSVVILLSIVGTSSLFYGLLILQATIVFWTTEGLELFNIVTYGGVEACQYPISIYPKGFRLFFTFVIPIGATTYYPLATLLEHESYSYPLALLFPGAGFLFLYLSCKVWSLGVRRYSSTGS